MDKQAIFLLADIAPGAGSSAPEHFVVTKKLVFFTADDNTTGRELYVMSANVARSPKPAAENLADKFHEKEVRRHWVTIRSWQGCGRGSPRTI